MALKREDVKLFAENKAKVCKNNDGVDRELFTEYGVKRGLRDLNGKGVLTGITNISRVESSEIVNGKSVPCEGKLYFRGYKIQDLVKGFMDDKRFGFEEVAYLLLFGELPNEDELNEFKEMLAYSRRLPTNFVRDVIMKAPSEDIMNSLTRSVLTLASYDKNVSDTSLENVIRQCIQLIAVFPMLSVYGYHAYNHYKKNQSLYIHRPKDDLSTSENLLIMLRPNKKYT